MFVYDWQTPRGAEEAAAEFAEDALAALGFEGTFEVALQSIPQISTKFFYTEANAYEPYHIDEWCFLVVDEKKNPVAILTVTWNSDHFVGSSIQPVDASTPIINAIRRAEEIADAEGEWQIVLISLPEISTDALLIFGPEVTIIDFITSYELTVGEFFERARGRVHLPPSVEQRPGDHDNHADAADRLMRLVEQNLPTRPEGP